MDNESKEWYWHSIEPDIIIGGLRVGKIGSMKHIINDDDEPVTTGYHSFYMKHGTLRGKLGATDEIVAYESPEQVRRLKDSRNSRYDELFEEMIRRREDEHLTKKIKCRRRWLDDLIGSEKRKPFSHYSDVFWVSVFLTIVVLSVTQG